MGFSDLHPAGYAVTGGEGRSHLPGAVTPPPAIPHPVGALAVVQIPSPSRPFAGVKPTPPPPVLRAAPRGLAASLLRAASSTWSAPPHQAPARPVSALAVRAAPLTGAVAAFNPITTAGPVVGAAALPVPRLLFAGSLIVAGLVGGGAWRWLAVAGGVLGVSAVWTFVHHGGEGQAAHAPAQVPPSTGPAIEARSGRGHF